MSTSYTYALRTNPAGFFRNHQRKDFFMVEFLTQHSSYKSWKVNVTGAWCQFRSNIPIRMDAKQQAINHFEIKVYPEEGQGLVRFLPFLTDQCTYMKLDPEANVVFTSQLSGCHVYIATSGDEVWMIHANANSITDIQEGYKEKRSSSFEIAQLVGARSFDICVERGYTSGYPVGGCGGIFFGQKSVNVNTAATAWGFYFFSLENHKLYRMGSNKAGTNGTIKRP